MNNTICELRLIDVKSDFYVFYYFYKSRVFFISFKSAFLTFLLFFKGFLFSSGEIIYLTKPAKILLNLVKSCIKRLYKDMDLTRHL